MAYRSVTCVVCGQPIPLEIAFTDDQGRAVHQECYVSGFRRKEPTASTGDAPGTEENPPVES